MENLGFKCNGFCPSTKINQISIGQIPNPEIYGVYPIDYWQIRKPNFPIIAKNSHGGKIQENNSGP
jgi:hypothetical protein